MGEWHPSLSDSTSQGFKERSQQLEGLLLHSLNLQLKNYRSKGLAKVQLINMVRGSIIATFNFLARSDDISVKHLSAALKEVVENVPGVSSKLDGSQDIKVIGMSNGFIYTFDSFVGPFT